jgi:hypothetical protein
LPTAAALVKTREFVTRAVVAFANSGGGTLLLGVREDANGAPVRTSPEGMPGACRKPTCRGVHRPHHLSLHVSSGASDRATGAPRGCWRGSSLRDHRRRTPRCRTIPSFDLGDPKLDDRYFVRQGRASIAADHYQLRRLFAEAAEGSERVRRYLDLRGFPQDVYQPLGQRPPASLLRTASTSLGGAVVLTAVPEVLREDLIDTQSGQVRALLDPGQSEMASIFGTLHHPTLEGYAIEQPQTGGTYFASYFGCTSKRLSRSLGRAPKTAPRHQLGPYLGHGRWHPCGSPSFVRPRPRALLVGRHARSSACERTHPLRMPKPLRCVHRRRGYFGQRSMSHAKHDCFGSLLLSRTRRDLVTRSLGYPLGECIRDQRRWVDLHRKRHSAHASTSFHRLTASADRLRSSNLRQVANGFSSYPLPDGRRRCSANLFFPWACLIQLRSSGVSTAGGFALEVDGVSLPLADVRGDRAGAIVRATQGYHFVAVSWTPPPGEPTTSGSTVSADGPLARTLTVF